MFAWTNSLMVRSELLVVVSLVALTLSGCTVGPDYIPPDMSVSSTWHSELKDGLSPGMMSPELLATWWTLFNDPELSSLIERAVANNLDFKKALAQVREARSLRGVEAAGLFPTLDASGSAIWSHSEDIDQGSATSRDLYAVGFDAGWELDIFGGVRRSVEAAEADLQASREELCDVLVSLLAEVATNYIEVRIYQTRLTVAETNLEAQTESCQLALWRFQAGLSDNLAVYQASYNLESTRSEIPDLQTRLEEAKNRLAVLLGEEPGKIHKELEKREAIPIASLELAVGIPADMLRRRPDIRQAEYQLAAQTARVGVATADLYPKFTLNGSIGLETLSLRNPSSSGSWSLSGMPQFSWSIFQAGAIRKKIEVQSALQEQYLLDYEATVLEALEEVENALVAYVAEQARREALSLATQAAKNASALSQLKYQAGLTDFDDVLEAQRSLLSFQEQLAQSEGSIVINLVSLYKALGGGWNSLPADKEDNNF